MIMRFILMYFFEQVSDETCIEVVTEGILTSRLQHDPLLSGVGAVILDEFHERSLHADLAIALLPEVQQARPDLRVLVMSATLDGPRVAALLGNCPVITSPGRSFPVDVRYAPPPAPPARRDKSGGADMAEAVAAAVAAALREEEGSVLAFLPGAWEIKQTARALRAGGALPGDVDVCLLYGDMPRAAQDAAIRPASPGRRKVVMATSIAETSLTINGIRVVVDSGLARRPVFDPRSGMTRLVTVPASRAAADQRAGRAGRTQPGVCIRLWAEESHAARPEFAEPEILGGDLTRLALELAGWGAAPGGLTWLDPPAAAPLRQAHGLLRAIGALEPAAAAAAAAAVLSAHGRRLLRVPLHPRLGHMALRGAELGLEGLAGDVAAVLDERGDVLPESPSADLRPRVAALAYVRGAGPAPPGGLVDEAAARRAIAAAAQIVRACRGAGSKAGADRPAAGAGAGGPDGLGDVGMLVALAYPDRVGRRRGAGSRVFGLANGEAAALPDSDDAEPWELAAVADCDSGGDGPSRIRAAAPVTVEQVT
jgi:ATP-dependent helicase HrpB